MAVSEIQQVATSDNILWEPGNEATPTKHSAQIYSSFSSTEIIFTSGEWLTYVRILKVISVCVFGVLVVQFLIKMTQMTAKPIPVLLLAHGKQLWLL